MRKWSRRAGLGVAAATAAVMAVTVGGLAGTPTAVAPKTESLEPVSAVGVERLRADVERVPGNYPAWSALGYAYLSEAKATADPSLYARSEAAFERSLQINSEGNADALAGRASLAATQHEFEEALALSQRALEINEYSLAAYGVRVDALNELGRYDEATEAAQRMLDLRPKAVSALTRASYVLELRGGAEGAETLLKQADEAATLPEDKAFARHYLGDMSWDRGDLAGALQYYDSALEADPTYLASSEGRARVLIASGKTEEGLEEYSELVKKQPLPEYLLAYGEALEAEGDEEGAQEQYEVVRAVQKLYAANGQDVDTELAAFEADHGSSGEAAAYAKRAYDKRPDAVFVQSAYATALLADGRAEEALPVAKASVRLGTNEPELHYRLGIVAAAAGDEETAREALRRALELNPEFSPLHAPRAQRALEALGEPQ